MFANKKLTLACPKCGNHIFHAIANPQTYAEEGSEVCNSCAHIVPKSQLLHRARKRLHTQLKKQMH